MTEQDKIKKGPATQEFVLVDEIKEGTVILKNGGLRAILMCGSRNLELESIDSQNAIISAYADFINSFDWPIQIIIHSRKLDVGPYLKTLEEKLKVQENELLKIQTAEYVDFIRSFVTLSDIMVKRFYVCVPFDPIESKTESPVEKISSLITRTPEKTSLTEEKFKEYQTQLLQRVEHTILALAHVGIKSGQLQTNELIELFYNLYNPNDIATATTS
ncbi:MAG: hypothetical protein UV48_C0008G0009 [Candidatus Azambacteria bacterium GW2011_GWA2_42_9]|uniref:TraC-like domain-containing protein n=3 Tax=Candidatus Azamiibacteriota TaxID=1752741 RepID=A0A0G0ZCB2_9BACT|nr:MAG: hypothetical protein UV07_C0004G0019 [Candidatus Azambacteria bacterium GW2011_GWB1_42_17]KKS46304.1 MAG: hypothetical protein UV10_C0004G0019 [Candidatus Azambacteria bacterium GW2011_GWA1_42_19]KKS75669.1 MAG: hypothetical protein UV48_C0008G0009 [Candidatus Azambacteria bacterium GW2011_GWA2_42_9]KKS88568.1 MAG: hypothetical protein UV62_C0005G0022 [Parcubacteria group bacterium GW2011_GWC1_43_11]